MEANEPVVKFVTQWLADVAKLGFTVTEELLARLKTWDRFLWNMRPQNGIYQSACTIFIEWILPSIWTTLVSKGMHFMSQGKSDFPPILQPKFRKLKGDIERLKTKINEIDGVISEIEGELKTRSYTFTEDQKLNVEMHLMDVKAKSEQVQVLLEEAEKTMASLFSDLESYRGEEEVSGWKVFLSVFAGAVVGGLGAAFSPAPVVVVAGLMGGIRGYQSAGKGNVDYENLKVKLEELRCELAKLETDFKVQEPLTRKLTKQIESKVRITGGGEI